MSLSLLKEQYFLYAKSRLLTEQIENVPSIVVDTKSHTINDKLACFCANIFDTAIDQLHSLGASLVPKTKFEVKSINEIAKLFFDEDSVFDPITGDYFQDSMNKNKRMKIYYDSARLVDLFQEIRNELKQENRYTFLEDILFQLNEFKESKLNLFKEEKQNHREMLKLKHALWTEERDSKKTIQELNEQIAVLKYQTEDIQFQNLISTRYVDQWENARMDQMQYKCKQSETEIEQIISNTKILINKENRVNTEIITYLAENKNDLEVEIENWMNKYDKESDDNAMQIQILKDNWEDLEKEHKAFQAVFKQQEKEINDYLEYKEKKRIEDEYLAMLSANATKIQAWWRGLMVRLQLGPFNPNPPKKGKKKAKIKTKRERKNK